MTAITNKTDWVSEVADRVEQHVRRFKPDAASITCASGISPSGPIHVGNLREVMTVHLVAEELASRGWSVRHVHSWDDYDRLRKIPAGAPETFAENIGRSISDVPDPWGEYDSYAVRYETEFEESIAKLGIRPIYIRQSVAYKQGVYNDLIREALQKRELIFDTLLEYQTLERDGESVEDRRDKYYPFKVYCENCGKDSTDISEFEAEKSIVVYSCRNCSFHGRYSLNDKVSGKLVWKVDWPMRWRYEGVDFEPGGEDHSSPGSSYTVSKQLVRRVFGYEPPVYVGYAFVGAGGKSKISSSAGTSVTPKAALDILEPAIIRWLYARREPKQKFDIDFGEEVLRLYDEWDSLTDRVRDEKSSPREQTAYHRSVQTASGAMPQPSVRVPFRLLSSVVDMTQGNDGQVLRIVQAHYTSDLPLIDSNSMEPRLTCARNWSTNYQLDENRTHILQSFDHERYESLSTEQRDSVALLLEKLEDNWSIDGLTSILYGIPKLIRALPLSAAPNEELKAAQRAFFVALYSLICGRDTGPRLPTLFLSIGKERVVALLSPRTS